MKKLSISIFFVLFAVATYSQEMIKIADKSIYEIGDKITSCESNFKNLFNNWSSRYIDNADQTILISCQLIETIKDDKQIDYYASLITNMDAPQRELFNSSSSDEKGAVTKKTTFKVTTAKDIYESKGGDNEQLLSTLQTEMSNIKEFLITKKFITVGDKIFLIMLESEGKIYKNYVVCDPNNFKVKWDSLFDFPIN